MEWNELSKEKLQVIKSALIMEGIKDNVDERKEIERVCITEEINVRQAIQLWDNEAQATREARICAALDAVCTSSIGGKSWLEVYMQELGRED